MQDSADTSLNLLYLLHRQKQSPSIGSLHEVAGAADQVLYGHLCIAIICVSARPCDHACLSDLAIVVEQEEKLALRRKLEECTKQLQSNGKMIRWLNDQVGNFFC